MNDRDHNDDEQLPEDVGVRSGWVIVAEVPNRTLAEFAVNGLKSYEIPAVIDARPGALGTAGMLFRSLRTGRLDTFRIMVPAEFQEEAEEVIGLFLGATDEDPHDETEADEDEEE